MHYILIAIHAMQFYVIGFRKSMEPILKELRGEEIFPLAILAIAAAPYFVVWGMVEYVAYYVRDEE